MNKLATAIHYRITLRNSNGIVPSPLR